MNRWIEEEQQRIVQFMKAEYWRLALGDRRFAYTRALLTKDAQ
jgi:hypothetical protein